MFSAQDWISMKTTKFIAFKSKEVNLLITLYYDQTFFILCSYDFGAAKSISMTNFTLSKRPLPAAI
jgi:hypothetical protein